jgi:hypothetical protein
MSLRLIISPQSTNVVPLQPVRKSTTPIDEQLSASGHPCDPLIAAVLLRQLAAGMHCEHCPKGS